MHSLSTEVLAASLRNARQTREAALAGAHIATLPFDVLAPLLMHEKTFEGMELFTQDVVPEYAELLR
jgi:transaldolase